MDPLAAIRDTFFQECEEQLGELESGLMQMEAGKTDAETVNAVFRAVHSIKGGAGAFSLEKLVHFSHIFETVLDNVRSSRIKPAQEVIRLLLRAADALADLVRAARDGVTIDDARIGGLDAELRSLAGDFAPTESTNRNDLEEINFAAVPVVTAIMDPDRGMVTPNISAGWTIRFKPHSDLYAKANETALLMREIARLGLIEVSVDSDILPDLAALDPEGAYLTWTIVLKANCDEAAVRAVFDFVEDDCELDIQSNVLPEGSLDEDAAARTGVSDTLRTTQPSDTEILALIRKVSGDDQASSPSAEATASPSGRAQPPIVPELTQNRHELSHGVGSTIRVDLDRVDRLIDLVGELVINEAMLSQRVLEAGLARASAVTTALDELEHLTREIQDSVMAIRAQPVRSVFQRMPRLVREVAAMTGKQVRLLTDGEGTEVDKTVIERIIDPLTHMIRNAIDHGLESTETRVAVGKPEEGLVKLTALHRSGRIVIEVEDDGAGINRDRVRAKAIENGLIPPDAQLSDEENDNLIFMPGFSTASEISDISGRGVGMDVVRRSVQSLGGRISIASRPGQGSTFTLSLPLTLAVLDGMVVSVDGHTLIIPLSAIVETLQPRAEHVHKLGVGGKLIAMRGGYIPIVDVGQELGYRDRAAEPEKSVALLVEGEGGIRAVLIVDGIHGQRQVVIKSLEANYRAVQGIAAATVMGDGRVALILDVDAIVSVTRNETMRLDACRVEPTLLPAS